MKLRWKLGIGIPAALLVVGVVCWFTVPYFRFWVWMAYQSVRPIPPRCKQRSADFQARVERIKTEANSSLRPGTKKAGVISFFASENIPVDFHQTPVGNEASGQIYITGLPECASAACGDDSALIGVRVDVDGSGTVVSDPVVVGMYTDCL
jgi:hypothetical protein